MLQVDLGAFKPFAQGSLLWHVREEGEESRVSFAPMPFYPSVLGLVGVTSELPEWHLRGSVVARFAGAREASQSNTLFNSEAYTLPGYVTFDVTLSSMGFEWLGEGKETRLSLMGRNLLGATISEPGFDGFDVPMAGRTVLFEVRQAYD